MEKPIIIEQQDRVVIVTLNRPAARNALNSEIMNALATDLAAAGSRSRCRLLRA